MMKTIPLYSA